MGVIKQEALTHITHISSWEETNQLLDWISLALRLGWVLIYQSIKQCTAKLKALRFRKEESRKQNRRFSSAAPRRNYKQEFVSPSWANRIVQKPKAIPTGSGRVQTLTYQWGPKCQMQAWSSKCYRSETALATRRSDARKSNAHEKIWKEVQPLKSEISERIGALKLSAPPGS